MEEHILGSDRMTTKEEESVRLKAMCIAVNYMKHTAVSALGSPDATL